ncbi:hypothetical protein [Methylobacterium sp. CCH5-D2]|uniref:hypothetical protein n=1 Tax=Methylobacterium sp. CCH5-D2 TaxID=1768765 RepID=UPI0008343BE4|nr:hypothetical protein [Methylobacterium sp. CCH5-D2]
MGILRGLLLLVIIFVFVAMRRDPPEPDPEPDRNVTVIEKNVQPPAGRPPRAEPKPQPQISPTPQGAERPKLQCMITRAGNGSYSSYDGGKSALAIMMACPNDYAAWVAYCETSGPNEDGRCDVALATMVQVMLKQAGR